MRKMKGQNNVTTNINNGDGISESRTTGSFGRLLSDQAGFALPEAFPYLKCASLLEKREVCRQWKGYGEKEIDAKGRKSFSDNQELKNAVKRYCSKNRDEIEAVLEDYGPIQQWDVSLIQDFSCAFESMSGFNEDISSWNTSNATNMESMFRCARRFNQDISRWNTSNVTNMKFMFLGAESFTGDLSSWNVSNVSQMREMFCCASKFNSDLKSWDVSRVTDMSHMFFCASNFQKADLSLWNVSRVVKMDNVFFGASKFNTKQLNWSLLRE